MTRERRDELRAELRQLPAEEIVRLLQAPPATPVPDPADDDQELLEGVREAAARLRRVARDIEAQRQGNPVVSRKRGQRILGPYEERAGWRVIEVDVKGDKTPVLFPTEAKAQRYVDMLLAELQRDDRTTEQAVDEYELYLRDDKGNKKDSVRQTCYLIRALLRSPTPLSLVTKPKIEHWYSLMRKERKADKQGVDIGPRFSPDSHRSALIQCRTFFNWCISKGWMTENPADGVEGVGKRRARGKSMGKDDNKLRIKQTRAWYQMALFRAHRRDEGAVAALVELLLGPRPCEIVSCLVGDVDEDEAPADLLWVGSKTSAGRRVFDVPEVLRPFLISCCEGKRDDQYLFEAEGGGPHWRDWVQANVQRICKLAEVPLVTAYYMRGQLATITSERGLAGHLLAAHLGHEDEKMAQKAYAAPGSAAKGVQRRGLAVLDGGLKKKA